MTITDTELDRPDGVVYNPFDRAIADNPYPVYQRLRDEAPVYHNPELDFYAVSRFEDVLAGHLDHLTFSSAHGVTIEGVERDSPFLIVKDLPDHFWHRKVVGRVFTPASVAGLEPFIRATAAELLDPFRGAGGFDVVEDFSIKLPLEVISELLGIPRSLRHDVHALSDRIAARDGSAATPEDSFVAMTELHTLLVDLVRDRRANPGDDVISLMMLSEVQGDEDGSTRMMTDDELAFRFIELAFAGHETVAKLLANGVVALYWYPDQRSELVRDRSLLPNAVEEMLRWDPPSQYQGRWTTREVTLHGVTIPADRRVVLITGAATHDERRFANPELFSLHRKIERHVSLGFGIHLCLGAALARLESRVAFDELLNRFPTFEVATQGVERSYSSNVRGLAKLPIITP